MLITSERLGLRKPAAITTKTLSPLFSIHMLSTCSVVSPQVSAGNIKYSRCSLEHQNPIEGARVCKQMNSVYWQKATQRQTKDMS